MKLAHMEAVVSWTNWRKDNVFSIETQIAQTVSRLCQVFISVFKISHYRRRSVQFQYRVNLCKCFDQI